MRFHAVASLMLGAITTQPSATWPFMAVNSWVLIFMIDPLVGLQEQGIKPMQHKAAKRQAEQDGEKNV
jgi:hypothetical protein